ncbi:5-oxoprolinase subunit PxpA [Zunongwangia sp. F363]|uniref:5-oxoprolinase subunit PxpA n=1 Tax=Autumnicola tepida TaxID=3075595 RepID=A0ABU3CDB6_9FLAO|nr:5-oxoprolinase subunit PxpA [Zunongwangia sp. F363]MDT0644333.1 5-oxoprolinase subunit PxpA [Zunongwangia sp. F363]
MKKIHINCDLGEGATFDAELMPHISACNIACGGHAGDEESIRKTIHLAIENNVEIGAHPSYPDKENFGRNSLNISAEDLKASIKKQVKLVQKIAEQKGVKVTHVKPHGALYNDAAKNKKIAELVLESLNEVEGDFSLYAPFGSVISKLAEGKIKVVFEAFADRNYNPDLSLVSRSKKHAIIHEKEAVFEHVFRMYSEGKIQMESGEELPIKADTFCVHSDTENAVEILQFLQQKLRDKNVKLAKI